VVPGSEGASLLRLTQADQSVVEYIAKQSRVVRTVRQGDGTARHEVYELPRGSQPAWSVSDNGIPVVTLAIERHVGRLPDAADDLQVFTIVAGVGIDQSVR
jgi:hypothetical protein